MPDVAATWTTYVDGYRAVARELGYELLQTRYDDWKTSFGCVDFWFRNGTYLDLVGCVVTQGRPPGTAPGFNFAQFRTFARDGGRLVEIYSAGIPDPEPRAFGLNAWIAQRLMVPLFARLVSKEFRGIPMTRTPELATVDRRHDEKARGHVPLIGGTDALEFRWSLQEELERESESS